MRHARLHIVLAGFASLVLVSDISAAPADGGALAALRDDSGRWRLAGAAEVSAPPAEGQAAEPDVVTAWVWSRAVPPRKVDPSRWREELLSLYRGKAPPVRERLVVRLATPCAPRCSALAVLAAPLAMWQEVGEEWIPAWPMGSKGQVEVPRRRGEPWRVRLVGEGQGGWWQTVPSGELSVLVAPVPASDLPLLVASSSGELLERFEVAAMVDEPTGYRPAVLARYRSTDGAQVVARALPLDGRFVVVASAPGHVPRALTGRPADVPHPLRLPVGAHVVGRFVDPEGRPVSGVEVAAEGWLSAEVPLTTAAQAKSDETGAWRVGPLPAGRVGVRGVAPERRTYQTQIELVAGQTLDMGTVELLSGATLRVLVVDPAGEPVAGATVATPISPGTSTGRSGVAVLSGLSPREAVELRIEAPGLLPAELRAVPPWPDPFLAELRPGLALTGVYATSEGTPVAGGTVRIESGNTFRSKPLGAAGEIDLLVEPETAYVLVLTSRETPSTRVRVEPGLAGERRDLGVVRAAPGLVAFGRLVSAGDGLPVAGARVWTPRVGEEGTVAAWAFGDLVEATSKVDGEFQVTGLAAQPHELVVEASGFARRYLEVRPVEEESMVDLGLIELAPGATVEVDLKSFAEEDGEGLQARLDLRGRWRESDMLRAPVVDGAAEFVQVPAGESLLTVLAGREIVCEKRLEVPEEGILEVACDGRRDEVSGVVLMGERPAGPGRLTWQPPTVEGLDGAAIFNQTATLGARQQRAVGVGRPPVVVPVKADGTFHSDRLGPGSWQVVWQPDGGDRFAPESVELPAGGVADLVLRFEGSVVAGRVVDEEGEPVARAVVRELGGGATALSGEDGGFRFAGVEGAAARLQAQAADRYSALAEVPLEPGRAPDPVELVVRRRHGGRLAVQVWAPSGAAGAGAFVFAEAEGEGGARVVSADRDGRAELTFREPLPRRVRIAAYLEGRWSLGEWVVFEEAREGASVEIGETGSLVVEVDEGSGPLRLVSAGGWDLARLLGLVGVPHFVAPGRPLAIGGLPPGLYTAGLGERTVMVTVERGEETAVRLD